MMLHYGIRTEYRKEITRWFMLVRERLEEGNAFVHGTVKFMEEPGVYWVVMQTTASTMAFLIGPLFLILSGVAAWLLWKSVFWSNLLVWAGCIAMLFFYGILNPWIHRFIMRVQLRRITGAWVPIEFCTEEVLEELAYGKI